MFAAERVAEIGRQVALHQIGAVGGVAAPSVRLAEGIVDRCVEGAGGNKRAELRDCGRQRQFAANRYRRFQVLWLKRGVDIDRVCVILITGGERA